MKDNYMKFRFFMNKQRETKFSNNHEDVDAWLTEMRFKPFDFCDEMCYKRYFVYNGVQYSIILSNFIENKVTIYVRNCENGQNYESRIEFENNESRIVKLGDKLIEGLNHLNIDIGDCNEVRI